MLFATASFAYGSFFRRSTATGAGVGARSAGAMQLLIAIYGGYFGGGIGFLMPAALMAAGLNVPSAASTKNVLAGVMNAAAVTILFTPHIPWLRTGVVCVGAVFGGLLGAQLLRRVDERLIRALVVVLGVCLTIGLFIRSH